MGITFCSCLLIIFYYAYFSKKLFSIPFAFTPSEGLYLWEIWHKKTFFDLYSSLISKFVSANSIENILQIGRTFNIFALGLQLISLLLIFKKEKVNFLASLISLLMFLSIPLVQTLFYQARPELWALAIGNFALYLFMQNVKSLNLPKTIFIGFVLSLPFLFTHQIGFLAFPLAVIGTLFLLQSYQILFKIFISSLVFCTISFIFFHQSLVLSSGWQLRNLIKNFEPFYAWSFWCFWVLILLVKPSLKANFQHPAFVLFVISLIFGIIQAGFRLGTESNWLILFSASCWMIALFLHNLILNTNQKTIYLISILVVSLGIFTPLLEPVPLTLINQNPQTINKTLKWISEEKNNKTKIISEDISLSMYFNPSNKPLQKTPTLALLEENQINQIIVSANPDPKLLIQLKQNYIPLKRIFVLGTEGFVFQTKWLNPEQKIEQENNSKNTFATFHPI